jgi:hypothetical protein
MCRSSLFLAAFLTLIVSCAGPTEEKQVSEKHTPLPTPTNEELRLRTQEQLLKGENHHDGAITLEFVGTIESVPALLKVIGDNPPSPNGTMVCTTAHAIDALKKITGANPGYTYKAWKSWWDRYQKNQRSSNRASNSQTQ